MTAPGPQRPACRPPSLAMLANRTRFSPAGPMHATRTGRRLPSSNCALTVASVSMVDKPIRWSADWRRGMPSVSMCSKVGSTARPMTTNASPQARFNSTARWLDDNPSAIKPVRGERVITANLLEVVRRVPTRGLVTKISGFSGSSAESSKRCRSASVSVSPSKSMGGPP